MNKPKVTFFDLSVKLFGGAQRSMLDVLWRVRDHCEVAMIDGYDTCPTYHQRARELRLPLMVLIHNGRHSAIGTKGGPITRVFQLARALPELLTIRHRLHQFLRSEHPDVLIVISTKALLIAISASRGLGVPILYWCHGRCIPPVIFKRRWHRHVAGFVCLSRTVMNTTIQAVGPVDNIHVVPNAVDVEALKERAGRPLEGPLPDADKPMRLLVVGTLLPTKGQDCAIRTLRRLVEAGRDAVLYLAGDTGRGDGGYRKVLEALAEEQGVGRRVHLLGWREDVPQLMARSTVFVLPSHTEGMPLSVMEAMALGVPVVVTPVGSVPEMLDQGRAGWLFDIDNDQQCQQAVLEAHRPDRRAEKVAAAAQQVARRYSPAGQRQAALAALAAVSGQSAGPAAQPCPGVVEVHP